MSPLEYARGLLLFLTFYNTFAIMHEMARYALEQAQEKENEGLSQIPPVPVHSSGSILVTPSSSL